MTISVKLIKEMPAGVTLWDETVTGLHIRGRETTKSWHFYYKAHDGARRSPKLGTFPAMPLEMAREVARELMKRVAKGEDPSAEKRASRDAPTVADLAEEWKERKKPPVKKPRSYQEDLYNLKNHIVPRFGTLRVDQMTTSIARTKLDAIEKERGRSAARHARVLLSGLFTLAESEDLGWRAPKTNPCHSVDLPSYKGHARRRKIEMNEFARVAEELEKLRKDYPYHVAAIWLALLCGTRITELVTALDTEVHGDRIIRSEHKTDGDGRERIIPLGSAARAELQKLPTDGSGYLFGPLGRMSRGGTTTELRDGARRSVFYVWEQAREAAGCSDLQLRDLRRTFASVAKSRGVSLTEVGEQLGHTVAQTTLGYAWLFDDRRGEISEAISAEILRLARPASPTRPLALRRVRPARPRA